MSFPNILSSHMGTDWMRPQMAQRNLSTQNTEENLANQTNSINASSKMRKTEFPPLSFYTAESPLPLHHTATSRKISHLLNSLSNHSSVDISNPYNEGVDQLSLELSCRLQKMKDVNTFGYTWLIPAGVDKTMMQMVQEAQEREHNNAHPHVQANIEMATEAAATEDMMVRVDDAEMWTGNDARMVGADSREEDSRDITGMMSENYGQMQDRTGNTNSNTNTQQQNQQQNEVPNGEYTTEGYEYGENILEGDNGEEQVGERDLDADISNHDESYDYYEGTNSMGDHNDHTGDYDVGNDAIVVEEDEEEDYEEGGGREEEHPVIHRGGDVSDNHVHFQGMVTSERLTNGEQHDETFDRGAILHSSFIDVPESYRIPIRKASHREDPDNETGYFMAYEEYQDDHSILDGQNSVRTSAVGDGTRTVSVTTSAYTRESALSHPTNSSELMTASMANPAMINQSTGNTSVDNNEGEYSRHINTSDYNMTLE